MRSSRIVAVLVTLPALAFAETPEQLPPLRISLDEAMRAVDRTSHPLAAARATTDRAAADVTAARSGYLPQITLTGSYLRTLRSEFQDLFPTTTTGGMTAMSMLGDLGALPFGREHTWRTGVQASEQLWDGGRTSSTVALARGSQRAAELDVRARHAQAVLDVTEAYDNAALAARVVAIGEASLALAERTLAQARVGFQQGATPEFDVVRAEVTRDNQRTSLLRARADRDQAFLRLRQQLGLPLDRPIELTSELGGANVGELARTAAHVPRGGERVSVAEARASVDIRRAQIGVATAARWPTLSIVTDYGIVDYPSSLWPDQDWRTNWTVGVNVAFPLFTGFRTTAQIQGARADQRAAEELLAEAVAQADLDARRTESDAEVAGAMLATSHHSTELARRAYEIADVRYRQGVSTYLELVDARIALDQAQINEARAARDVDVARVRIALLPALPVAGAGVAPSTAANLATAPSATTSSSSMSAASGTTAAGQPTTTPNPATFTGAPLPGGP